MLTSVRSWMEILESGRYVVNLFSLPVPLLSPVFPTFVTWPLVRGRIPPVFGENRPIPVMFGHLTAHFWDSTSPGAGRTFR